MLLIISTYSLQGRWIVEVVRLTARNDRSTYVILRPCPDSVVLPIRVYHMTTTQTAPGFPSELIARSQQTANTAP